MKRPKQLNATFVKTIRRPGRYGDGRGGHGLSLLVKPTKTDRLSKTWAQRLRINGRTVNIGLGSFPVVTLAEARKKALANRRVVAQGGDPRGGGIPTFEDASERVINVFRASWKPGGGSEKQWRSSMRRYVFPRIGRKRVDKINTADVMGVLLADDFWNQKRETARRVRQRIGQVMKWGRGPGLSGRQPGWPTRFGAALPKNGGRRKHFKALPHAEVASALAKVRRSRAWTGTKLAIHFMVYTATRPGETRLATWDEIDLETATWTIPGKRMKGGREHRVPLSPQALGGPHRSTGHSGRHGPHLPVGNWPGDGERHHDQAAPATRHFCGFAWLPKLVSGLVRRHRGRPRGCRGRVGSRAYGTKLSGLMPRGTMFKRRRRVMDDWAGYLTS